MAKPSISSMYVYIIYIYTYIKCGGCRYWYCCCGHRCYAWWWLLVLLPWWVPQAVSLQRGHCLSPIAEVATRLRQAHPMSSDPPKIKFESHAFTDNRVGYNPRSWQCLPPIFPLTPLTPIWQERIGNKRCQTFQNLGGMGEENLVAQGNYSVFNSKCGLKPHFNWCLYIGI